MIKAKPVIANRYWILRHQDRKIGEVEQDDQGVTVKIRDQMHHFKTIPMMRKRTNIEFEPAIKPSKAQKSLYGFDPGCRSFNHLWNVKFRVPLFTKTEKSKSWFAAGWYRIQQGKKIKVIHNPKLILLERYKFQGPFHSKEEAID